MPDFSTLSFDAARGRRIGWAVLLLAVACSFFVGLGLSEVVDINEGLRLMPPVEMIEKGDWVVPRLDGDVYINKPPLIYWVIAAAYKVAGAPSILAGRMAIALICVLTVLATVWIGRRRLSEGAGFWAGLILATGVYFHAKAQQAELDPGMTLAITLSAFLYWLSFQHEGRRRVWVTLAAGVMMGVAFMLKGPVLFPFLLAATLALWVAIRPRWQRLLATLGIVVALALVVALPWCAMLIHRLGFAEVWHTMQRESLERVVKSSAINSGPIYFYVVQIAASFLPWTPLLLFWCLSKSFREYLRRENKPFFRFAVWFALFALIIFSLIKGKETKYLQPIFPYLALLCGVILNWLTRPDGAAERTWRWLRWGLIVFAAAACLAPAVLAFPVKVHWVRMTWATTLPLLAGASLMGAATLLLIHKQREARVAQTLACVLAFAMLLSGGDNLHKCRNNMNVKKSAAPLAAAVARESAGATVYRHFSDRPHDLWYLRRVSTNLPEIKKLPGLLAEAHGPVLMLVRHKSIASLEQTLKGRVEFTINPHVPKTDITLATARLKTPEKDGNGSAEIKK